jgi:hypothetical protein
VPIALLQGIFIYTTVFLPNQNMIAPSMQGSPVFLA